jgi:hypothetical protein
MNKPSSYCGRMTFADAGTYIIGRITLFPDLLGTSITFTWEVSGKELN